MRSNQSIKVIRSPKYGIAKNEGADMHDTAVPSLRTKYFMNMTLLK